MAKNAYRVRNWKDYNRALVRRGSLTFWFSQDVIENWKRQENDDGHGNQKYSDMVIVCGLTLRQLFRLPLRATEGMMKSLVDLMKISVEVPDYSTLSRRGKDLSVNLGVKERKRARHVLVDSTGVQVMGEGEWKKLLHGESRHQVWCKLHIAMDADHQEIVAALMTESIRLDGNYLPRLIDQVEGPIDQITGDGAYDKKNCYHKAYERKAKAVFPPQHNACVQRNKQKKDPALEARDKVITDIGRGNRRKQRLKAWNNYHRRSNIETMMFRMKTIFGDQMRSKTFENQQTDLLIRCYAMNRITSLGMPQSVIVG